jgi:hypothetical protein
MDSQMAVRFSVIRIGRALLHRNIIFSFWYSFPLEAGSTAGPSAAGRIR